MIFRFDDKYPIFLQISEFVKIQMITGVKKPGEKLSSVRDFAKSLKINPNTVQKAYQYLEEEGVIKTEKGSGNYITNDEERIILIKKQMSEQVTNDYLEKMKSYGFSSDEILKIINKRLKEE